MQYFCRFSAGLVQFFCSCTALLQDGVEAAASLRTVRQRAGSRWPERIQELSQVGLTSFKFQAQAGLRVLTSGSILGRIDSDTVLVGVRLA